MRKQRTQIPPIKSLMTAFPYSIPIERPIDEARRMMEKHSIRHLPVMQESRLAGVISAREVALALSLCGGESATNLPRVRDACLPDPLVVDIGEPADNVLLEMSRRRLGSALVVREGKLVGIFTVTDACREFGNFLRSWFPRPDGDRAA